MLELFNLTKRFGGLIAVNNVSFSLKKGEIVGLLGPNGSGKSTIMNLVSGVFPCSSGSIKFSDAIITGLPAHKIAHKGLSRTFQLVKLTPSLNTRDNVILALAFSRKPVWGKQAHKMADEALEKVGLAGKGDLSVLDLNYIDQKRVELARAIATAPDLLLLDEWMAGLNPAELSTAITLIRSLSETGISILLVEHIMEAVRALCPRCIVMNAGSIIADGQTSDVLSHPEVISAYLGESAHV